MKKNEEIFSTLPPEETLVCRIIEQAIEDYRELKKQKIEKVKRNGDAYSLKDIEHFFKSNWCDYLLESVHSKLKGKDVLKKISELPLPA